MHFCRVCSNMYYCRLADKGDSLTYYCRNCGDENENPSLSTKHQTIIKNSANEKQTFPHIINKYTKLDHALPRTNTIQCVNSSCESNQSDFNENDREIIIIRYDNANMKYVYLCSHCDQAWTIS